MIVFLDMDGVMADFDSHLPEEQRRPPAVDIYHWDPPAMFEPGFFRTIPVMPGSKEAVRILLADPRLDVYVGSKPTTKGAALACPSEKYQWIGEHFPPLLRKMVLVCDKALLRGDILVDDDPQWKTFRGYLYLFDRKQPEKSWEGAVAAIGKLADELDKARADYIKLQFNPYA